MRRIPAAMLATFGFLGSLAHAQETITFSIQYSSPVLTPGQSQTISVWATFAPGIGQPAVWNTNGGTGQVLPVAGFQGANFHLLNMNNGHTGTFSNLAVAPPLFGSAGTAIVGGHIFDASAGQIQPGSAANPIKLWSAQWTPVNYLPREVTFNTWPSFPPGVWLEIGVGTGALDWWTPISISSSFQVIPAPSGLTVLALGALITRRRRR